MHEADGSILYSLKLFQNILRHMIQKRIAASQVWRDTKARGRISVAFEDRNFLMREMLRRW